MITLEHLKRPAAAKLHAQGLAMQAEKAPGYYKMFFKDFKESA